ncbi:MAG: penicillin-insensitive murein endopeptidase [Rhodobacteraceae bacterium]|nr:penicillin-insensitive murein endopeptidase [Paracoccaceae bacterium]
MAGGVAAEPPAKVLFGAEQRPSEQRPAPLGSYARGCLAGAEPLVETGPRWQAMRLSRNRNWAHPNAIRFVERLSQAAVDIGWNGIYVGDMSQPRGGPMLTGHRSHQIGLDMDIWLLPPARLDLSARQRENISSLNVRSNDHKSVNANWLPSHMALLRAAAKDPAVARIFVAGAIKMKLCADATGDRRWLRKIRPWWGHNTHFHVRLNCPRGANGCVEQDPIPRGDGCAAAEWWVTDALAPPAPAPPPPNAPAHVPKPELTMASLPTQCAGVLAAR